MYQRTSNKIHVVLLYGVCPRMDPVVWLTRASTLRPRPQILLDIHNTKQVNTPEPLSQVLQLLLVLIN